MKKKPIRRDFVKTDVATEDAWKHEQEYQHALKAWRHARIEKYDTIPMGELPITALETYLSEYGLKKRGARMLQEFRLQRYREGLPVQRYIATKPDLDIVPNVTILQHRTDYDKMDMSLLRVPRDVIRNRLLAYLCSDLTDVYHLMRTSRQFQSACHGFLTEMARRILGSQQATPYALSIFIACRRMYPTGGEWDNPPVHASTTARLLNVSRKELSTIMPVPSAFPPPRGDTFAKSLVLLCIRKNGYADNLMKRKELLENNRIAKIQEQLYIDQFVDERINQVNATLRLIGYSAEQITIIKKRPLNDDEQKMRKNKRKLTGKSVAKKRLSVTVENKRVRRVLNLFGVMEFLLDVHRFVLMKEPLTVYKALSKLLANRGPAILQLALDHDLDKLSTDAFARHLAPIVRSFNSATTEFASPDYPMDSFLFTLAQVFRDPIFRTFSYATPLYCGWSLIDGVYHVRFCTTTVATVDRHVCKPILANQTPYWVRHLLVLEEKKIEPSQKRAKTEK